MTPKAPLQPASPWLRPQPKRRENRADKEQALLRTAARLFINEGFHTTSLDRVAQHLGVTKPTLYYYFDDKDEILFRCSDIACRQVREWLMEAVKREGLGIDLVVDFFRRYIKAVADDYTRCFILIDVALSPQKRKRIRDTARKTDGLFRVLLQRGIEDGSIATCDVKLTTFALFGAANWVAHWYQPEGTLSIDDIAEHIISLFVSGLRPRKAD